MHGSIEGTMGKESVTDLGAAITTLRVLQNERLGHNCDNCAGFAAPVKPRPGICGVVWYERPDKETGEIRRYVACSKWEGRP